MITFPIVSFCFYSACIFMIFLGGKSAEGGFNQDFLSLRATKSLQGVAAFCVLAHHIAQLDFMQKRFCEMQIFTHTGFLFVGLFFFVSGYGLLKSLDTKPNYLQGFLRRRCVPIIATYYVMNFFYVIWHLIKKSQFSLSEWICKIFGIALLNDNAWFVPVILLMYFSFYVIFKNVKNRKAAFTLMFAVIAIQVGWFLFNKHFPWWLGKKDWWKNAAGFADFSSAPWWKCPTALWFEGEWWVNSTVCFFLGMIVFQNEKKFFEFFSKNYWKKFVALFLLAGIFMWSGFWAMNNFGYWREFAGDNTTFPRSVTMLFQTLQVASFVLFVVVFMMKFFSDNGAAKFFGKHSLEFYLMQAIPLRVLLEVFGFEKMDFSPMQNRLLVLLYVFLVIAISVLLAILLKKISSKISKRI